MWMLTLKEKKLRVKINTDMKVSKRCDIVVSKVIKYLGSLEEILHTRGKKTIL